MKRLLFFTLVILSNVVFSQEYKLGNVTVEELKETEHKTEKNAAACKLFSKAKTYMTYSNNKGFELVTEVENKIKIYTTDGFKYANHSVSIYTSNTEKEIVNFSDAVTYNLVNGKIEKTKLKSEGEFTEKTSKFNLVKKITMPNVKIGSIVEYKYVLRSPFFSSINEWFFQDFIPVNYSSYQLSIPEYFTYNPFFKGTFNIRSNKSFKNVTHTFTNKESIIGTNRTQATEFYDSKLTYKENVSNYELSNVPSIQDESYVKNIYNYISSISHELASVQYPNTPFELLSTTWEKVANTINASENFGGELVKTGFFEEDVNALLAGKTTNEEKIASIYNFVKNNFKWNGYYGIYTDEGLRSTYKNKTGNVADLNLLLTAILRYAKINAHPVLISSVSNGIPSFPSRTAFNYVVAGIELDGKTILLDATDKYALPNILPARAVNWVGRMIYQKGGSKEVDLETMMLSKDNIILSYVISEDGKASGNLKRQLSNYYAYNYRNSYGQMELESIIQNKEKSFDNIEIENYKSENINDLSAAVIESFDFIDDKHIEVIGDKMYLSPLLFFGLEANPFKLEERTYPIEFRFPFIDKYLVSITIPDGYEVESFPKTENLLFSEKILAHKYIFTNEGKTLKLMLQDEVNTSILAAEDYQNLKEYFQKMVDKQTEKIVLKKI